MLTIGDTSRIPPASKCSTRPSELNGRTKNCVSATVFARPTLAKGSNDENRWLKRLFQSAVMRPVLKPWLESPVGAVNSSVVEYFRLSFCARAPKPRNALPSPLFEPPVVVVTPVVVDVVEGRLTK